MTFSTFGAMTRVKVKDRWHASRQMRIQIKRSLARTDDPSGVQHGNLSHLSLPGIPVLTWGTTILHSHRGWLFVPWVGWPGGWRSHISSMARMSKTYNPYSSSFRVHHGQEALLKLLRWILLDPGVGKKLGGLSFLGTWNSGGQPRNVLLLKRLSNLHISSSRPHMCG